MPVSLLNLTLDVLFATLPNEYELEKCEGEQYRLIYNGRQVALIYQGGGTLKWYVWYTITKRHERGFFSNREEAVKFASRSSRWLHRPMLPDIYGDAFTY